MSKEYVDIKLAILLQLDTAGRNVILYIQIDLRKEKKDAAPTDNHSW